MTINLYKTRWYRRGARTEITPHSVQTQSKHIDNNVIKPYSRTEEPHPTKPQSKYIDSNAIHTHGKSQKPPIRPCTDKKEEYEEREKRIKESVV